MATITIKNIDRCIEKLNKIADVDMNSAVKKATTFVHGQAKVLAPVDTGALSGSIHMEVKQNGKMIEGRVYTNMQYAPYVEFGTGVGGNGSYPYELDDIKLAYREDWGGMPAQPYMYPALKGAEKYVESLINKYLDDKLKQVCK